MLIVCIYLTEDFRGTLYNELNKMSSYIDDLKDIYNYKSTDPIGFEEELKTLHQRVFKILPNDLLDTHNKLMADFKRQLGILK